MGRLLENSNDLDVSVYYLKEVNAITKKNCYSILSERSKTNKYLRNYKNKIDSEKRRKYRELPVDSLSTMLKKIKRDENIRLYWGKKVDKNILQQFAKKFLLFENDNHIEKGLRIFSKVKFPLGYKLLLPYLESSSRKNINYTLECLAFFKNNTVRQIGLKYIRNKAFNDSALKIFEKIFSEEDIELFNDLLMTNNEDEFHGVSFGINDIFHENRSPKAKPLLRRMYNRLYCSMCRLSTIEAMKRSGVLDNNIINEMQFDSYEETRKLYKKITSKK